MLIGISHLNSCYGEPVLVWIEAPHREEIAKMRNRFRGHLMMSFSVVMWGLE